MSLTVDEILCILGQDFDPWSDPSLTAKPHQRAKSVHLKEGEGREDRESREGKSRRGRGGKRGRKGEAGRKEEGERGRRKRKRGRREGR